MDPAVIAWLTSQLGTATNLDDLTLRYTRLGSARAVALEVLRLRLADLIASPGSVSVSGVVSVNFTANIAALERQIDGLENGEPPAPDDPDADEDGNGLGFGVILLKERPRR
jgi:hypothetical protein